MNDSNHVLISEKDRVMTIDEFTLFGKMLNGPEAREAMTAFMERREPDFSKF